MAKFSFETVTNSSELEELKAKLSAEQSKQLKSKWASFLRLTKEYGDPTLVDWTEFKINMIRQELLFKL